MNVSTCEIVDTVFDEYTPKIMQHSSAPRETVHQLKEMRTRLTSLLYDQYYQNTSRFMRSIDIDDVIHSSPPRERMIKKMEPKTPAK